MLKNIKYISLILSLFFIPIYLYLNLNVIPIILYYSICISIYICIKRNIDIKKQFLILLLLILAAIFFSFILETATTYYILTILNLGIINFHILITINNLILKNKELNSDAMEDDLTKLYNKRYFMNRLNEEVNQHIDENRSLCLLMLDLDYFKKCNDCCGHLKGDEILKKFAQIIKNSIRQSEKYHDIPVRYGGEEFSVILLDTNLEESFLVAERIRKNTENFIFSIIPECYKCVECKKTVSIGISSLSSACDNPLQLIDKADDALYKSKETRNTTNFFDKRDNTCKNISEYKKYIKK